MYIFFLLLKVLPLFFMHIFWLKKAPLRRFFLLWKINYKNVRLSDKKKKNFLKMEMAIFLDSSMFWLSACLSASSFLSIFCLLVSLLWFYRQSLRPEAIPKAPTFNRLKFFLFKLCQKEEFYNFIIKI